MMYTQGCFIEISSFQLRRHCEERSDEAIHVSASGEMDCFAALAMTGTHQLTILTGSERMPRMKFE